MNFDIKCRCKVVQLKQYLGKFIKEVKIRVRTMMGLINPRHQGYLSDRLSFSCNSSEQEKVPCKSPLLQKQLKAHTLTTCQSLSIKSAILPLKFIENTKHVLFFCYYSGSHCFKAPNIPSS